jgi:hypothetical protein
VKCRYEAGAEQLPLEGRSRSGPGRTTGYDRLGAAVDRFGFYWDDGTSLGSGYRP